MDDESRFWRNIEGDMEPEPRDAIHWLAVYEELLRTLEVMQADGLGDAGRIATLVRVLSDRCEYWRAVLHDGAVAAARAAGSGTETTPRQHSA